MGIVKYLEVRDGYMAYSVRIYIYIQDWFSMNGKSMNLLAIIPIAILVAGIASSPALASSTNTQDTQQDYTDFQNCLSSVEVDGAATEQQIQDCLDSTYGNTDGSGDNSNGGNNNDNNNGGSSDNNDGGNSGGNNGGPGPGGPGGPGPGGPGGPGP